MAQTNIHHVPKWIGSKWFAQSSLQYDFPEFLFSFIHYSNIPWAASLTWHSTGKMCMFILMQIEAGCMQAMFSETICESITLQSTHLNGLTNGHSNGIKAKKNGGKYKLSSSGLFQHTWLPCFTVGFGPTFKFGVLKNELSFFIENSAYLSVDALLHSHDIEWCRFFQSTWIANSANESVKFAANAIRWCQWFFHFRLFVCENLFMLVSECDKFQSNFVLVMYIHVWGMFYLFFLFTRCKFTYSNFFMANNGIGQPFHLQKKKHSYKNDGQQNL